MLQFASSLFPFIIIWSELEHLYPITSQISRKKRQAIYGQKSVVIWFTGLSGSGKSTLASALEVALFNEGYRTYLLDGDNIRTGLNKDLAFTDEGRNENIRRIGEVSNLFVDAGVILLSAFISPFRADREQVKNIVGEENFIEVFVDCPLEICEKRDVKGLYKKARAGEIKNFTGIDSPYEAPEDPAIVVPTHIVPLKEAVEELMEFLKDRIAI